MTTQSQPQSPPTAFWLPLVHPCGCCIDWGVEAERASSGWAAEFFPVAARFPCPVHGSASGIPAAPLRENEIRYLVQRNVSYRLAKPEMRDDGQRNAKLALERPSSDPSL